MAGATAAGDRRIRAAADVGGTFTDVILYDAEGRARVRKVLSTPPHYDKAVVDTIADLLGDEGDGAVLTELVHGTTVATNAVLERRGARTGLVTTAGFRDVLELRRVRMPHLYDLFWDKPDPLVPRALRFEVRERMAADGTVLTAVDEADVRAVARALRAAGVEAVAVCLLHAHRHPAHEEVVGRILRAELPGVAISLSSEILREQQEYERTATTVVNSYVRPLMDDYLADLRSGLAAVGADAPVTIMQSSGGVMTAADAVLRPVYVLESGPAAGVVAAASVAAVLGWSNVITFDMGGTTAKASLLEDGRVARSREYEVGASLSVGSRLLRGAGELIRIPTIDIAEVGAGGGSIAWLDAGGGLQVGPRSAGAAPGPACYGNGGDEATVTDANVALGYIAPGPLASGDLTVDADAARAAVDRVGTPLGLGTAEAARGIHELANARMMRALRAVSSEKGRDPAEFALLAFGGAGPVHATGLADELGVQTVLVPPLAGLFSAAGLLFARTEFHDVRFCNEDAASGDPGRIATLLAEMQADLEARIGDTAPLTWSRSADVRYRGQSWDVEVPFPDGPVDAAALAGSAAAFEAEHERLYGLRYDAGAPIEIRAVRLAVLGPEREAADLHGVVDTAVGTGTRRADFGPAFGVHDTPVVGRADVATTARPGPLLVDEYDTTVVVPPSWSVRRGPSDVLVLEKLDATPAAAPGAARDTGPVTQQIVANALAATADEMATTIFRTAHSTVVRDVMDFSAALCGPTGETVAQAVTIPFHLGSIPTAMRAFLDHYDGRFAPGDVFIMNDPFDGGIHLPDIYILKPVFTLGVGEAAVGAAGDAPGEDVQLLGFAVTVAHHGDVGGRLPGSSATDNTEIFQEGLRLPWLRYHAAGAPVEDVAKIIRANVRVPAMTFGDLTAQVAACNVAERALRELADRYGAARLQHLMTALVDHTERLIRSAIRAWPDGTATFTDHLDSDGIETRPVPITATVTIAGDEITVDLSESAPMVAGSLNSTRSFVEATVFQAVMSAAPVEIPSTSGAFRPITVITKPGTVTHVVMPGASSMRGVTGFRVWDTVNGALAQLIPERVPAAGEGGNMLGIFSGHNARGDRFVYFELVVGTWGARPTADANDGLCNPCATAANIPIEVAEAEFPIRIERYGFVPDSGGAGRFRGGLAIERAWRPLVDVTLNVRSDRQVSAPYGLFGGDPGARSANLVGEPADRYPPMFSTTLAAGTLFHHVMAGGGGWGDPYTRDPHRVAADVRNGKVSPDAAAESYGVVLGADGEVDAAATRAARDGNA